MIFLDFTEPDDLEWMQWIQNCNDATEQLIKDYQNGIQISITNLYSEQKERFYGKPFYGKCAYCESSIEVNSPTYVDHYRPKGGIRYIDNTRVMIQENGVDIKPHPGYYWLAYDWRNLLPTCWKCNTWHEDQRSEHQIGKGNRFPLENQYAINPGEEVNEEELLINPMFEDPADHIYIDELGIIHVRNRSTKGETVIEVFGLNVREALLEERKTAYDNIKRKIKAIFSMDEIDPRKNREIDELNLIKEGSKPYTISARKVIRDSITEIVNTIGLIR